ncbi:MAG: class I SAM-dependent methyltransferase [Candidatus Omnitrophica bacterium]|nr:class I SAM-dependent methyltransferase [Candidatus Omnitrophota bacterium]
MAKIKADGGFRTGAERLVGKSIEKVFNSSPDTIETKLDNFTKYIRRQRLTRLLALYEIFKRVIPIKGSIVECGVYRGFSLMAWAQMSAVMEPNNLTRRIYGFDTFEGFAGASAEDSNRLRKTSMGELKSDSYEELKQLIKIYDSNRFLGHVNKIQLIKGDVTKTIPEFINKNRHLVVSLLFLDMDLYNPTKAAIEAFYPRMPKGAIIAFDELDNPIWPGETAALLETLKINKLKVERIEFDPYIGFAVVK